MATATRTRSMSSDVKDYLTRHVSQRLKSAQAGEIVNPDKVEQDADFIIQCGNSLKEAAKIARQAQPVTVPEPTVEPTAEQLAKENEKLKKQLASLQSAVKGPTMEIKKRGRRNKVA